MMALGKKGRKNIFPSFFKLFFLPQHATLGGIYYHKHGLYVQPFIHGNSDFERVGKVNFKYIFVPRLLKTSTNNPNID